MDHTPPLLTSLQEITPARFGEVGRPYQLRHRGDGQVVALCSAFDHAYWPFRGIPGLQLQNRISVYSSGFERRLAVFDGAAYHINDIAFHPSHPWLAIGTGSFDGGFFFEGELLLWNWETGEYHNLLGESREVVRCCFEDAYRLKVLLRPRDEEEYEDAFATYVGLVIDDLRSPQDLGLHPDKPDPRLASLVPIEPASLGFRVAVDESKEISAEAHRHLADLGFESRSPIEDVAWLSPERVAAVHGGCQLEIWRLPNTREVNLVGDGHGAQLLHQPDQMLVHVLKRDDLAWWPSGSSKLYALRESSLVEWRAFDRLYTFSVDRQGRVLARDLGDLRRHQARHDRVLDPSGEILLEADLGHYDPFNHYIRLDGGEELYFLRGTPTSSHTAKRMCGIDHEGTIRERMNWDGRSEHLMDSCVAFGPTGCIVRAYGIYSPSGPTRGRIELCSLTRARTIWRHNIDSGVTALVSAGDQYLIFALTDGHLGIIDMAKGKLIHQERLTVDGVPTVATALATHDQRVLIGTLDGRLLLYTLNTAAHSVASPTAKRWGAFWRQLLV